MSREKDCTADSHFHVGQCQRAGYANGRADALDEVEQAIAALVAEIEGVSSAGGYRVGLQHGAAQVKASRG